jgi:glyoxylase-like metal-dependent hydrolase (beta-lactamase superfamily II)/rhodanese-related sulfurtransferase
MLPAVLGLAASLGTWPGTVGASAPPHRRIQQPYEALPLHGIIVVSTHAYDAEVATMYFKQILDERCGCASYLVASRQSREAAIIDPAIATEQYEALLRERDFRLVYVIDTHVHADHISGARRLAASHGATVCLHESAKVAYPFRPLADGEELALGQVRLRVLHTPGHRPELISLLVVNPPRSPEPSMVLTGDSLLVGDVGRPDFGGGDAAAQYESMTRLLRLPDWVAVFPGHFEGPCGKGMCGRPSTTIGFERLYNALARLDRAPFVATLTDGIPARPLNMTAIEATNRGRADLPWAMLTTSAAVPEIDTDDLAARAPDAVLLDVREPEEYAYGHVPGAVNLPQADLASRLDEVPRDRPVLTICQAGMRSLRAAQFLKQVGFERVMSVRGGTGAWRAEGRPIEASAAGVEQPRITESEWTHAGVLSYSI